MARDRYTTVAITLHWLIAFLLICQILGGLTMVRMEDGDPLKFQIYQTHKSFGITILLLTLIRLGWRLTHKPPPLPAAMPQWERIAARGTHAAFYVLLIVVPLLGWSYVSASPFQAPTMLFGQVHLPHLPLQGFDEQKDVAEFFEESHELAAKTTLVLLLVHVAAALKHQFVNRDEVLSHMLPFLRRKG
jgi:cytochrome b561